MSQDLERLRAVLRRIESRARVDGTHRPPPVPSGGLSGEVMEADTAACLVLRRRYPLAHRQGNGGIDLAATASPLPFGVGSGLAPGEAIYLDTETTGLAGGTGTYPFLIGLGRFTREAFEVEQFFMRDFHEEPALLDLLARRVPEASGLVTYNGQRFDLPLLETRYLLARRPWPGQTVPHLDLLPLARRLWRGCVADFRLGSLEAQLLGHERENDVPGALIPHIYFRYLRDGDLSAIERVFEHNAQDLLSLAVLTGRLALLISLQEVERPEEWAGLGRFWEERDWERSAACYREALTGGLPRDQAQEIRQRLGRLLRRLGCWEEAREVWTAWAEQEMTSIAPLEELAKYLEHRARDLRAARQIVVRALGVAEAETRSALPALQHRLNRLDCRLAGRRWY